MSDSYGVQDWVSFYNDSGEEIPSYACLMFVSDAGATSDTANFSRRLRARQFTDAGTGQFIDQGLYALNSRVPVPAESYGKCTFAIDAPAFARIKDVDVPGVDLAEDAQWIEREYGPIDGKWSIGPEGAGFRLLTRPQQLDGTSYHRVLVMQNTGGGGRIKLFTSAESDVVLGPRNTYGVSTTGVAYMVASDESVDTGTTFDVDCSFLSAVVFPNEGGGTLTPQNTLWAVLRNGTYYAVSGGATAFEGTVATPGSPNLITPEWPATDVGAYALFSETLVEGQEVMCVVKGNEIVVGHAGCVPVD